MKPLAKLAILIAALTTAATLAGFWKWHTTTPHRKAAPSHAIPNREKADGPGNFSGWSWD